MKIRRIHHKGQWWFNEDDLKKALDDRDLLMHAAAMMKIAHEKGEPASEILAYALGYFYTTATGALEQN